jgi:predicted alpha/beta superfamily hydrolase
MDDAPQKQLYADEMTSAFGSDDATTTRRRDNPFWCSVIVLLIYASSAAAAQERADPKTVSATPLVIGETLTIPSEALGEMRKINIYLPAGYASDAKAQFPVMYMPDGGMAEDFLHIAGLLQVLSGNGTMRPFVLVGIENTERRRDMTGPTVSAEDRKIAPRVGGSAAFRTFIRTELMPLITSRYRTTAETAIVGESLAGLFVVETFFLEHNLFDTYIAFDPSLWWNEDNLVKEAPARLKAIRATNKTLYFASSNEPGIVKNTEQLAAILQQSATPGLTWRYDKMPGETHGTIYHPAAIRAFRALFAPPTAK